MPVTRTSTGKRRSSAWVYYLILAIVLFIVAIAGHPGALVGTAIFGVYSAYLYRGGSFVLWIW